MEKISLYVEQIKNYVNNLYQKNPKACIIGTSFLIGFLCKGFLTALLCGTLAYLLVNAPKN